MQDTIETQEDTMNEREELMTEWFARYDDVQERFGADLRPCSICGTRTIDPAACEELHEGDQPMENCPTCDTDSDRTDCEIERCECECHVVSKEQTR
jgi:hypothetical protein